MKKNCIILIILLIISIAYNFYQANQYSSLVSPCENKGRYSEKETTGALRIKATEAAELVDRYRNNFPPEQNNNHPTGFVFTKRMFDEIFETEDFNSVTLDLISYQENITLVVKGYKTDLTKIDGTASDNVYLIQGFCPDNCSQW